MLLTSLFLARRMRGGGNAWPSAPTAGAGGLAALPASCSPNCPSTSKRRAVLSA